jgi:hypothetical protein
MAYRDSGENNLSAERGALQVCHGKLEMRSARRMLWLFQRGAATQAADSRRAGEGQARSHLVYRARLIMQSLHYWRGRRYTWSRAFLISFHV